MPEQEVLSRLMAERRQPLVSPPSLVQRVLGKLQKARAGGERLRVRATGYVDRLLARVLRPVSVIHRMSLLPAPALKLVWRVRRRSNRLLKPYDEERGQETTLLEQAGETTAPAESQYIPPHQVLSSEAGESTSETGVHAGDGPTSRKSVKGTSYSSGHRQQDANARRDTPSPSGILARLTQARPQHPSLISSKPTLPALVHRILSNISGRRAGPGIGKPSTLQAEVGPGPTSAFPPVATYNETGLSAPSEPPTVEWGQNLIIGAEEERITSHGKESPPAPKASQSIPTGMPDKKEESPQHDVIGHYGVKSQSEIEPLGRHPGAGMVPPKTLSPHSEIKAGHRAPAPDATTPSGRLPAPDDLTYRRVKRESDIKPARITSASDVPNPLPSQPEIKAGRRTMAGETMSSLRQTPPPVPDRPTGKPPHRVSGKVHRTPTPPLPAARQAEETMGTEPTSREEVPELVVTNKSIVQKEGQESLPPTFKQETAAETGSPETSMRITSLTSPQREELSASIPLVRKAITEVGHTVPPAKTSLSIMKKILSPRQPILDSKRISRKEKDITGAVGTSHLFSVGIKPAKTRAFHEERVGTEESLSPARPGFETAWEAAQEGRPEAPPGLAAQEFLPIERIHRQKESTRQASCGDEEQVRASEETGTSILRSASQEKTLGTKPEEIHLPVVASLSRRPLELAMAVPGQRSGGTASGTSASTGGATGAEEAATGAEDEGKEPDLDAIARDVYRILRRRLVVERERSLGLT